MGYPKSKIHIKTYLWPFWEIGIFENYRDLKCIKTHGKTRPTAAKNKNKLKNNKISRKYASNKGRNKYWMMRLDMLIRCYGHLKVMTQFASTKTPIIDDWFLNRRKWFQDVIKAVLDDPNDVFYDTFFFFQNSQLGFDTLITK